MEKTEKNDIMQKILNHDCGKQDEYQEFSVDEVIADEVEKDGQIKYRRTCDYTMVNAETADQENTHVIDYSGS